MPKPEELENLTLTKLIDGIDKELDQLDKEELENLQDSFNQYGIEHTLNVKSPLPDSKSFTYLTLFAEGLESLYAVVMNKEVS